MFERIKRRLGIGAPQQHREEVEQWVMSQAMTIASLVEIQLKNVGVAPFERWGEHRAMILGYTCGMTGHVCAKLKLRKNEALIALMSLAQLTSGTVKPDDMFNMLTVLQEAEDADYFRAHKVGWHDLGMLSPAGFPTGLEALIRDSV
jgi:hypothetical protein